jgi:hypothetical protein
VIAKRQSLAVLAAQSAHAKWHCEDGNMLGKDDCEWDRCSIFEASLDAINEYVRWLATPAAADRPEGDSL